jgi:serine/threonine protein kinase
MEKIGSYRIVRQLGQGGMGVVYEGINDPISRRVAIKVLHKEVSDNPDLLARFFNEARACNLASHPSIVDVYELGQLPDGRAYIVMQFLAGESLADRLQRRGGRLPVADSIRLIRQVASAMAAAHAKGIIHRDT